MTRELRQAKASKTVRLKRTACPCGWNVPRNVSLKNVVGVPSDIQLEFDCPECERRLEMGGASPVFAP